MGISVKLEVFEGPLDLLLHLLEKNKVNIYDIPIVEITNQYMEYMREMQRRDLNIMSEFLVMANGRRMKKRNRKIRVRNWYSSFWNTKCLNAFPMN